MASAPDKTNWKELGQRFHALAVFRGILADEVVQRFTALLDGLDEPQNKKLDLYSAFVASLYGHGGDFGKYLLGCVLENENAAILCRAAKQPLPKMLEHSMKDELATFSQASAAVPAAIAARVGGSVPLAGFANTKCDFAAVYTRRLAEISVRGYGVFAAHHMFTLAGDGALAPVRNPDPQRLADLTGYAAEREKIIINTRALLRGLPAVNVLLYGDAGTGKSSTVKAIANEYCGRGLRLVEIRKNQIYNIPGLMDRLATNPLKFIFFIDDLSFPSDDTEFTALKAILEGNVSARPQNIVVYATSNRRHMMRETFATRRGDDVSVGDTLEEEASLAARFGMTVTFLRPDRELFEDIVRQLALEYNLHTPPEELFEMAEVQALRHGGRSPRTARQFVEFMKAAEEDLNSGAALSGDG